MAGARDSDAAKFHFRDVVEIALGACVMAFPTATTEEVWKLGAELELGRLLYFSLASLFFLAVLIYGLHSHDGDRIDWLTFAKRVATTYFLTLLISALLLLGLDQLVFFSDPLTGLKRTILVAFPASFAATAVDSLGGKTSR